MWQRFAGFLVVLLLMFSGGIFAQENLLIPISNSLYPGINSKGPQVRFIPKFSGLPGNGPGSGSLSKPVFSLLNSTSGSTYVQQLGFICKKEWQLDKITPIAFRFRLGSLEYVNWMERKPNAVKPQ